MSELYLALVAIGGLVLALGLFSRPLKLTIFSAPMLALLLGILLSPAVSDLLAPERWGHSETILEEAARLTLAIGLMGVALRLPADYLLRYWRSLAVLLGIGMPLMCLGGSLLAHWVLGLPWLVALLVGAIVSPTDPIVATSIVTGVTAEKNLPDRVRHTLSAESGLNDGLAYPLVMLPVLLLTRSEGEAWGHWLGRVVVWEVGAAALLGMLLGLATGRLLQWAEKEKTIEPPSFLAYTIALSLLALGAAKLIGTDGILAVFVAGVAFDHVVGARERSQEEKVQEAVNQFFTLPIFVLFGLMLPWEGWRQLGWQGGILALAILLLHRLPAWLALKPLVPQMRPWKDAFFLGWFGPIGVAAVFYAMLALRHTGQETAWHASSLVVFASILAHGMTAAPLAKRYGRSSRPA